VSHENKSVRIDEMAAAGSRFQTDRSHTGCPSEGPVSNVPVTDQFAAAGIVGGLSLCPRLDQTMPEDEYERAKAMTTPEQLAKVLLEHESVTQALADSVVHDDTAMLIGVVSLSDYCNEITLRNQAMGLLGPSCPPVGILVVDGPLTTLPGKADILEAVRHGHCAVYTPPKNPLEERLVALWGKALGVSRVGTNDDLLDAGGESITVMRILSSLEEDFGVSIKMRQFMDALTVRQLAELIRPSLPDVPAPPGGTAAPMV
jgi:acyl carrier protein